LTLKLKLKSKAKAFLRISKGHIPAANAVDVADAANAADATIAIHD
jgi:hypothetical protein